MTKRKPIPLTEISNPTLGFWGIHSLGIDVQKRFSALAYTKHKQILKAYGYDIDQPIEN